MHVPPSIGGAPEPKIKPRCTSQAAGFLFSCPPAYLGCSPLTLPRTRLNGEVLRSLLVSTEITVPSVPNSIFTDSRSPIQQASQPVTLKPLSIGHHVSSSLPRIDRTADASIPARIRSAFRSKGPGYFPTSQSVSKNANVTEPSPTPNMNTHLGMAPPHSELKNLPFRPPPTRAPACRSLRTRAGAHQS